MVFTKILLGIIILSYNMQKDVLKTKQLQSLSAMNRGGLESHIMQAPILMCVCYTFLLSCIAKT